MRAQELVRKSIKGNTIKDYERYHPRWSKYLELKGFSDQPLLMGLERTTKLVLVVCFMDSENNLGHDYGKAMSSLRCLFRDNFEELSIFEEGSRHTGRKQIIATVSKSEERG